MSKKDKLEPSVRPEKGPKRVKKEKEVLKRAAKREKEQKKEEKLPVSDLPLIHVQVFEDGRRYETHTSVKMQMRKPWKKKSLNEIHSFIPGAVLSVAVKENEEVQKDQELMMYEAMKMHNVIRAPFDGTIERILVTPGEKLPKGSLMIVIRPHHAPAVSDVSEGHFYEDFE